MHELTAERLAELRRIAGATPRQEWFPMDVLDRHSVYSKTGMELALCGFGPTGGSAQLEAEHIAAFDPPTALALLAELDEARQRLARVEQIASASLGLPVYRVLDAVVCAVRGEA